MYVHMMAWWINTNIYQTEKREKRVKFKFHPGFFFLAFGLHVFRCHCIIQVHTRNKAMEKQTKRRDTGKCDTILRNDRALLAKQALDKGMRVSELTLIIY